MYREREVGEYGERGGADRGEHHWQGEWHHNDGEAETEGKGA